MITPVNYSLAAVNFFVGSTGLVQLARVAQYVEYAHTVTVIRTLRRPQSPLLLRLRPTPSRTEERRVRADPVGLYVPTEETIRMFRARDIGTVIHITLCSVQHDSVLCRYVRASAASVHCTLQRCVPVTITWGAWCGGAWKLARAVPFNQSSWPLRFGRRAAKSLRMFRAFTQDRP